MSMGLDFVLAQRTLLTCPNGKPLTIAKTETGEWVLGCFQEMCSVLIHHKDANKVLEKFVELVGTGDFGSRMVIL